MECAHFLQPEDGYINNHAHKPLMNGNFRHIIFVAILLNSVMLHGCFKVMMGRRKVA